MYSLVFLCMLFGACDQKKREEPGDQEIFGPVTDTAFWQEYHEAYIVGNDALANEVRSIAIMPLTKSIL